MNFAAIYFATLFGLVFDPVGGFAMFVGALVMKTRQGVLVWAGFGALLLNLFLAPKIGMAPLNAGQVAFTTVLLFVLRFAAMAIQGLIIQAFIRWLRRFRKPASTE
jgi:hypothetical protein